MLWTGLIAVVLAVLSYIVFEPSLAAVLITGAELFCVLGFSVWCVCLNDSPEEIRVRELVTRDMTAARASARR
jgi:hypothetical protein